MATIFLIRHGEPEITGVFLGQLDPPLSPKGQVDSKAQLSQLSVEIVWVSPLRRAWQTAIFIQAARFVSIPQLREIDQGEWSGKTWAEIEATWGDLALKKSADWLNVPAPGGETWTHFMDRIRTAWDLIRSGPSPAAIVAHQGVNAALAHLIDGRDPLQFAQQYGEVFPLEYY